VPSLGDSGQHCCFTFIEEVFPIADLEYCLAVDRFDFAMVVEREKDLLLMKPAGVNDATQ